MTARAMGRRIPSKAPGPSPPGRAGMQIPAAQAADPKVAPIGGEAVLVVDGSTASNWTRSIRRATQAAR